jgi:hypothetical protein
VRATLTSVHNPGEIESAIAALAGESGGGLIILPSAPICSYSVDYRARLNAKRSIAAITGRGSAKLIGSARIIGHHEDLTRIYETRIADLALVDLIDLLIPNAAAVPAAVFNRSERGLSCCAAWFASCAAGARRGLQVGWARDDRNDREHSR